MTVSLVIGGSSGIGLAAAQQLAERGDTVHIAGRSSERLAAAQTLLPAAGHASGRRSGRVTPDGAG